MGGFAATAASFPPAQAIWFDFEKTARGAIFARDM
jgi:hypothetical protein